MTGVLLVDKPQGWTSSDVVAKLRGVLHEKKIGHTGTLDPLATGLLIILTGRATRASDFVMAHDKEYIAAFRPGIVTDTQDITGTVLSRTGMTVTRSDLEKVLSEFTGRIEQVPPMYSAIKVKGKKLYEIARKGGEIAREPRQITVERIDLEGRDGEDYILRIMCSSGTYVRTLCHDIGAAAGCGGCMAALRRTMVGEFRVESAHTIDELQQAANEGRVEDYLLPVDRLFDTFKSCNVDKRSETKIRNGNSVKIQIDNGLYRVYSSDGEFLMLGRAEDGYMKTVKSFF